MYELNKSIKSLAVANDFIIQLNKACYQLGKQRQPFCFYANEYQKQYGVLDFATFSGFLDQNKTIVNEIADIRKDEYKASGIFLGDTDKVARTLFFDYLLSVSVCYIEIPRYKTKDGFAQHTYDKFLATKNPSIMGIWMDLLPREMQAKYSSRIASTQLDLSDGNLRCVKLNVSAKGNSITCPRGSYSVEDMTCIPLFMLYAFQKGFEEDLKTKILKFTYLKDNDTVRELTSTLNKDILMKYYESNAFVGGMLSMSDIDSMKQGGMSMSSKMSRGYIRVPELGSSIYDNSGVRALNLARLLKVEEITEPDTTFIHVDLESVEQNFYDCIDYAVKKFPDQVIPIYDALVGEPLETDNVLSVVSKLNEFVRTSKIILSTQFLRDLHVFMVTNPQWFPMYTGKPNDGGVSQSSTSFGVEEMDF